ncbi:LPS assembly lipoprotein LptE [Actibacterium ureilyticum]|uniref:LPS assembly lipoprotein LptE n=1 Tax=Actibacterium ureilyticum TaxID=1590614 RepID=UPI000BAAC2B2|nr:LPS assembly lipoprotein LptE [Actibacterium ureilyticum]
MSSSDRRSFLIALGLLPLAGCGFAPAYGTGGAATALRGQVTAAEPANRLDFLLVSRLEERLGRTATPRYRLGYQITTSRRALAITSRQEITRYNLSGEITYTLRDVTTGRLAASGTVESFASYSATSNTVATLTAERDAQDRLMTILADQIVTRLIAETGRTAP